jgi:hypothetical protein
VAWIRLLAIVLVAAALVPAGWAGTSPSGDAGGTMLSPGNGTVFIDDPSYTIPVKWSASCQNSVGDELRYHHWSVAMHVTRTKGSHPGVVGTQSLEYVGVNDSSKGPREQGMVVTLAPDATRETFEVKLWVVCHGVRTEIGMARVTVVRSGSSHATTTTSKPRPSAPPKHPGATTTTGRPGATAPGGAQLCIVPRLVGKTLVAARKAIVAAHCSVGVVHHATSTSAKHGLVVSHTPPVGAKRTRGRGREPRRRQWPKA